MNKFFIQVVSLLVFVQASAWAADPNWVVNDPGQYEHSMTVTCILNIDGIMANDVNDKIGAFIDGVCVGVGTPSPTNTTEDGTHVVSLTVRSSTPSDKVVTFKLYDASLDKELDAISDVVFESNATIGSDDPILITTNRNPTGIDPDSFTIMEGKSEGTEVGKFVADDPDGAADFVFTLVSTTGDNAGFTITDNNVLRTAKVFDYQVKSVYTIQVKASDGKGGELEEEVLVKIIPDPNNFSSLNYISPNGDGKNDVWTIRNVEVYKDWTVSIFNDAGNQLFSTTNYQNDWDGTYQEKELPVGVYYYLVKGPEDKKFTGTITLNR